MNLIIEEIKSWSGIQISLIIFQIFWGISSIYLASKIRSIQEKIEKNRKRIKRKVKRGVNYEIRKHTDN